MAAVRLLLVPKFFFSHNNLLNKPENFPLHFLPILGSVAQADGSHVTEVLGRKLEPVNIAPEK